MEDSSVEKEIQSLVSMRDRLRVAFEAIDDKTEKVSVEMFEWLDETDIIIQKVENLTAQTNTQKECKKLMRKIMQQKDKFSGFDDPSLEYSSSGSIVSDFVCFNSREKASDQLFVALMLNRCSIIGLYGRSGSGKTALVKAMARKIKSVCSYYKVLFVKVTQNSNIRTIQDEIADSLNIKFDKVSEAGRAKTIFSKIKDMNLLVIFDDVLAKFNPEDLGIYCNIDRFVSPKIILTTCCRQDCNLMYSQMDIQLGPLSTEDSWTLFQKHSGIDDEDSSSFDLLNVAREVAFECEGLPGKIIDVGSSLRSKPIEEWKATLDSLKHSMAKWQIFLSFRGEDTRYAFTGSLYKDLCQGGFKTFMDDGGLDTGDQISPSLLNAIEASKLSIIVLSENYANSSWCLDELVKIMECKKLKKQLVWPIFYKVDPSDIRNLRKSYGKDMAQHENIYGINSERVQKWRSALLEVSNLSGKPYTTGYEHEFIQKIVEDVNQIKNHLQI
ncbi:TMV resistance protein N [Trifolium repens]|nr:TMV resistance protein N [Trifolium repens]